MSCLCDLSLFFLGKEEKEGSIKKITGEKMLHGTGRKVPVMPLKEDLVKVTWSDQQELHWK